jgi:hypothetical protein
MSALTKTALTTATANATYLVVKDPGGPENIIIGAPTLGASYSLTLPNTDGTNGYVLTTDGSGILSWEAPGTGNITSVSGTAGRITSSGGANPVINIDTAYTGQNSIITLGNITTGTWNATNISLGKGGTGSSLSATDGTMLCIAGGTGAQTAVGTTGQLLVSGGTGVPTWSNTVPNINTFSDTTDSTSSSTGALVVNGGLGIFKNANASSFNQGYTTTATAAGTTTLNVSSTYYQFFTGTATQTVVMPLASTLSLGRTWTIVNTSAFYIIVKSSGNNEILNLPSNYQCMVTCILTSGTTAASWVYAMEPFNNSNWWTQQGSKIVGTGGSGTQRQGGSLSLSSDGNTLAVGGYSDSSNTGATWIFTRSGGVWTQQDKLVGTTSATGQLQGYSVSLSNDGNTLAVGGIGDSSFTGATWIFTRSAGVWTQQDKLVGATSVTGQRQGTSVSLSSDGNTLAVGGPNDSTVTGATWIFTRSAGVWTQQGSKLVGATSATFQYQGRSVSLSSDGNTLAVGGMGDSSNTSATWIFTRSAGVWTQQGSKLVGATSATGQYQGSSVSLSSDGNTLAVGGYGDSGNIGATWIFMRSAGSWTQQGSKIIGTTSAANQYQGYSVSLRGNTLAVGGEGDSSNTGATWVFTVDFDSVLNVYGTADRITSSGGQNPVIDIASTYAGQTSITTLGTITTGAWGSIINTPSTILSTNTTASTSTTTGSLINSGGFGNAGRIWTTDISVVNRNYCSIYTSSNISIPDNTPTNPFSISSGTVSQSGSVSGTSGGIITINENGMYIISTNTTWSNPSSLTGWRSLSFVLSSSVYGNTIYPAQSYDSIATTNGQDQSGCIVLPLTAGITLNLRVFQTSGSSVDLRYMTLLTVSRIIS